MSGFNGIVTDLARHPSVDFAVIMSDRLLPVRFMLRHEAEQHLADLLLADGGQIAIAYPPLSQRAIGGPLGHGSRGNPGTQPGAGKVSP